MKYIADLHIHSKYSRATAKNLDLENLYINAQLKGITVLGTGDATHPAWFSELKEKLVPAEEGLFKLKGEIEDTLKKEIPASCRGDVRFVLESEISSIYKKNDKTRKNHNLVFYPDFASFEKFNQKLDAIGNIKSDGRPILGLDAKKLLEILLDTDDRGFLIPAHIWTPWFSLLGSKSGFDSVEECFEDLSSEIFAVETGLSSDPPMNWRVSALDGLTLISNSDAHSPSKLGREANVFNTELSYQGIKKALKTGDKKHYLGTLEFYPEEGKYHMDGHRKCGICLEPEDSVSRDGICPECGKPLTLGVLYRVNELSDRSENEKPDRHHPFFSIIPLEEIISELLKVGPKSKKVQKNLQNAFQKLGPEFEILRTIPTDTMKDAGIPYLGEAIDKMRKGKIHIEPGYDGEFGKIHLFDENERNEISGQKLLFSLKSSPPEKKTVTEKKAGAEKKTGPIKKEETISPPPSLNELQNEAVTDPGRSLLIVAGPGTGKTLTLTHKIYYLIREKKVSPENILAITFTAKAAGEMKERLIHLIGQEKTLPLSATFHSLCHRLLKERINEPDALFSVIDDTEKKSILKEAVFLTEKESGKIKINLLSDLISSAKQEILSPQDNLDEIVACSGCGREAFTQTYKAYQTILSTRNLYDYDDLIFNVVKLLENDAAFLSKTRERFTYLFVDEYQDLNHSQYRIIRALASGNNHNICVIGDPDQAIYGFRGANVKYFKCFLNDYPDAKEIRLTQNYRSVETILKASHHVIKAGPGNASRSRVYSGINGAAVIQIHKNNTEKAETVTIGKMIEEMIGGFGMHSIDFGNAGYSGEKRDYGFSDFAILFRTAKEGKIIASTFEEAGIPYQFANKDNTFNIPGIIELISYLKIINNKGSLPDLENIIKLLHESDRQKYSDISAYFQKNSACTENLISLENILNGPSPHDQTVYSLIKNLKKHKKNLEGSHIKNQLSYLSRQIPEIKKILKKSVKVKNSLEKLIDMSGPFKKNISDFLTTVSLHTDTDCYDANVEKVSLMTMHASKGLEFPVVFITGCEKSNIPYEKQGGKETDIEEERRLFYVALTRAKEQLVLSYAKTRNIFGKPHEREISPFVKSIENDLLKHVSTAKPFPQVPKKPVQLELF